MNNDAPPLLFAHRGASGYRPEHTLEGYRLAIEMGADVIEPDLVISRDGVLVVRHENEISGTTNVASLPQFASRRRTQQVDGEAVTGWFVEDFSAAEIATLRARERLPALRPQSAAHDGRYGVPTLVDVLRLLAEINPPRVAQGLQPIGVAPETKHPSHFAALGLPFEQVLLDTLQATAHGATVYIQSFEMANLKALRPRCAHQLVFLVDTAGAPFDLLRAGDPRDYAALLQPAGLAEIATFADVLGAARRLVQPLTAAGALAPPSTLVADAHRAGLQVVSWTFRAENEFLPPALRRGKVASAHGDVQAEIVAQLSAGIDGFFTDFPDLGRAAIQEWQHAGRP